MLEILLDAGAPAIQQISSSRRWTCARLRGRLQAAADSLPSWPTDRRIVRSADA